MSIKIRRSEEAKTRRRKSIVGVLFIGAVFVVVNCTKIEAPQPAEPGADEQPQQELYNSTINFYQDDRLTAVLQAGRIRKFAKRSTVLLDSGVIMDFFNREGQHTSRLTSDSGRADESKNDMLAMGNVIAVSDSGQMLETEQLRWENRTRKIVSEVPVRLSTPTDTIHGIGFVSDENLKNWQIQQPTGKTFREFERREQRPYLSLSDSTAPADSI